MAMFRVFIRDADALDILMPFIPNKIYHLLDEYNINMS